MRRLSLIAALAAALAGPARAQTAPELAPGAPDLAPGAPDPARQDLAPGGVLRAAINFGNPVLARRDPATGAPEGVSVDLAREFGRRLGVPVVLVTYEGAGFVSDAATRDAWDICFLAVDPQRAQAIAFTAPYLLIEGTYLVRAESSLRTVEDADRDGVRIAVGRGSAYDLHLSRTLRRAQLVRAATSAEALALFAAQELDAAAGVAQPLKAYAAAHPGLRVIPGRFMAIAQAVGMRPGREAGLRRLRDLVEAAKAEGLVAAALRAHGQDATVAGPDRPR
ncbi:extracellular solute-binding protein family 3 [Methylobacterium sp. 4-46]|uniref:transporter substrate-binding domain-containing protein n=1 Tax=unclassified Methylobacterium TaxID=2615210 RepID=UPI000165C592|nr:MULTISPECIES: transporter substrate-binding domain-containing protein [Methylobacterium]ACA16125.1 extracellular solute-binding protein family 3 [Methylobacterium sp. 4-46]WFT81834.1 transporter substrate-binding domain-containing protein [Methylobacterium nodulans]